MAESRAQRSEAGNHAGGQDRPRPRIDSALRLTLLAPDFVEAIMDGRQAEGMTLPGLMKGVPVEWERQRPWQAT